MPEKNLQVIKSNDIINASYRLTVNEFRLLHAVIAQVHSQKPLSPDDPYEISVKDFRDLMPTMELTNIYQVMKQAADNLFQRYITVPLQDGSTIKIHWVHTCHYIPEETAIRMYFSPGIIKYVSQISSDFTRYQLQQILKLKHEYSYRFYELFRQNMRQQKDGSLSGSRTLTVEELRAKLELGEKYKPISELKRNVIEPALKDISKSSDISVKKNYEQIKSGRTITAFRFTFKHNQRYQPDPKIANGDLSPLASNPEARRGETQEEFNQRRRNTA